MNRALKIFLLFTAAVMLAVAVWFLSLKPSSLFSLIPSATTALLNHAGDPINIAIVGDRQAITKAFLSAHWLTPNSLDTTSTVRIVLAGATNAPYPEAPISSLYLFGRSQDIAFEFPTDTVRRRHHIRLWRTTISIAGKPLWVGAASYDSGIELSGTTAFPTHHISPNVDTERSFVAASLKDADVVRSFSFQRISRPTLWGFNGGGDWYFDDGFVVVLLLK